MRFSANLEELVLGIASEERFEMHFADKELAGRNVGLVGDDVTGLDHQRSRDEIVWIGRVGQLEHDDEVLRAVQLVEMEERPGRRGTRSLIRTLRIMRHELEVEHLRPLDGIAVDANRGRADVHVSGGAAELGIVPERSGAAGILLTLELN